MVNTTETFWDINGVPLQTLAYNVTTWGGDLQAPPPLRGSDVTIPYRPGEVFQGRRPAGRSLTFSMWVQGSDEDGKIPTDRTMREEFVSNFYKLRSTFWNQGKLSTLTRRWKDPITGTSRTASAQVVYANGLAPSMQGNTHATFTVELYMPDPFFIGAEVTETFSAGATSNKTINVLGDYETTRIILEFNGSRNNPRLTNTSRAVYVNVNQNLAAGQDIRLDIDSWTARKNPGTSDTNVIGSVTNFGHEFWFALSTGTQNLSLTSTSGTGTATLKYRPKWF